MSKDRAQNPGDVDIIKLDILSSSGEVIDIRDAFLGMDIFEDIFEDCITGAVTMSDELSLIENIPLIGNEKIFIVIRTPSLDSSKSRLNVEGRIYKISDRMPIKENTMGYILHFCSPEKIYSTGIKISKAYKDMLLSDMAISVYSDYIKPIRDKLFVAEETAYPRSILVPTWSPFFTLNWIAKNCKSPKYQGASYLFFERRDSFVFTSLESLFNVPSQAQYFYGIKNTSEPGTELKPVADFWNADSYKVKRSQNTLENLSGGMYSGKLISNDLVTRKIDTKYFNYATDFDKFNHLNKSKLNNSEVFGEFVTSNVTLSPKQSYAFGELDQGNYLDEIIMERKSQFKQIESIQIDVAVPGNTERAIGDIVTFTVPSYQPSEDSGTSAGEDPYLSGKYLVSALRHMITQDNHSMVMELSSDSFAKELPTPGWKG